MPDHRFERLHIAAVKIRPLDSRFGEQESVCNRMANPPSACV